MEGTRAKGEERCEIMVSLFMMLLWLCVNSVGIKTGDF